MENRANYALVGLFTLVVIAGAFGSVFWFKRAGEQADRRSFEVVFSGSVSGLSPGSAVRFNGLRVGEVTRVSILPSDPGKVVATIEIDPTLPMKVDTKARLESQGLTGVASVQLTGGSAEADDLVANDLTRSPVIFAERSDYQDVLETVQRLSGKLDSVLTRADTLLAQSENSILGAIRNVEAFSQGLADNATGISAFLSNISAMGQKVGALSERAEKFVDAAEVLVKAVDAAALNRSLNNAAIFSDGLVENKAAITTILSDTALLTRRLSESALTLDATLVAVSGFVKALDSEKLNRSIDGAEKFAMALGNNAPAVDAALKDVTRIVDNVTKASARLDSVLAGAEGFFGSGENGQTAGMMSEITQSARAIRQLSLSLEARMAEITASVSRLSGPGLREVEALSLEARRAIGDLSRATRSLEKNPQQFLFGARPALPEYGKSP